MDREGVDQTSLVNKGFITVYGNITLFPSSPHHAPFDHDFTRYTLVDVRRINTKMHARYESLFLVVSLLWALSLDSWLLNLVLDFVIVDPTYCMMYNVIGFTIHIKVN